MDILITGGAGFIGRNMIRYIRKRMSSDIRIFVLDNLSEDPISFRKQGLHKEIHEHLSLDLTSSVLPQWAFGRRFDLCIHCAAVIGGKLRQVEDPVTIGKNLAIDYAVMDLVSRGIIRELVYFSSCAAYGAVLQTAINTLFTDNTGVANRFVPNFESQLDVRNPGMAMYPPEGIYGWCKLIGEYLCSLLPIKVTVLRPFGGYGTDQKLTYPFPAILDRIAHHESPVRIYGTGTQIRDWIHVHDICRLTLDLAFKTDRPKHVTVNLGTGKETSFLQLAHMMMDALHYKGTIFADTKKPEGVPYRVADTTLMNHYGLHPEISLPEGIEMAKRGAL